MHVRPAGPGIVVRAPAPTQFGIHVARREPFAPVASEFHLLQIRRPAVGPASTQVALSRLYLPVGLIQPSWELASPGVEKGINRLWSSDPETGLSMPDEVRMRRAFDEVLRARILTTPDSVGLPFETLILGDLAWRVLARLAAESVASAAASLALRIEVLGAAAVSTAVALSLRFPGTLGVRLMNLALAGEVFCNHDCLRWIVRESAVGAAQGTWSATAAVPMPNDASHVAAAAVLFPCLLFGTPPQSFEVTRAFWVLHQVFRVTEDIHSRYTDDHDAGLAAITTIASLQPQTGSWALRLDRWQRILDVADNDPAIAGVRLKPSAIRAAFVAEVGLTTDEWLALIWFLGMRYMAIAQRPQGRLALSPFELVSESLIAPLGPRFAKALRDRAIISFSDFADGVLAENPGYAGLGSLGTAESLTARNSPLLEVAPDVVVPLGLRAIADRAVALPRLVVGPLAGSGGGREVNGTLGKCFEAYVREVVLRAQGRHRVLTGADIDAVVPRGQQRCDVLIAHQHEILLVEAGLQTLAKEITQGDVAGIRTKCEEYHQKADQADATRRHIDALARRYGLLTPIGVSTLLVTDVPVPVSPSLFEELQRQRPDRNPLLLASIDEFERLVAAGEIWSIPGLVANWQATGRRVPMLVHLAELRRLAPMPSPEPQNDARAWIDRLGTDLAA